MTVARGQIVLFLSDLYEHVSAPVKGHCTGKSPWRWWWWREITFTTLRDHHQPPEEPPTPASSLVLVWLTDWREKQREKASSLNSGHWSSSEYSVIITWVSHTDSITMIKHFIALNIILVSYHVMAMPMGEGEISNSTAICKYSDWNSCQSLKWTNWRWAT